MNVSPACAYAWLSRSHSFVRSRTVQLPHIARHPDHCHDCCQHGTARGTANRISDSPARASGVSASIPIICDSSQPTREEHDVHLCASVRSVRVQVRPKQNERGGKRKKRGPCPFSTRAVGCDCFPIISHREQVLPAWQQSMLHKFPDNTKHAPFPTSREQASQHAFFTLSLNNQGSRVCVLHRTEAARKLVRSGQNQMFLHDPSACVD